MPTANPRITITLEPSLHAILKRLSEATGNSMSSIVADLLGESQPILERMALVIESAKQATADARGSLLRSMEAAQADLEQHLQMTLEIYDDSTKSVLPDAEKVTRRRAPARAVSPAQRGARRGAVTGSTPPVTRGSGTPVADPVKTRKRTAGAGRKPSGGRNG